MSHDPAQSEPNEVCLVDDDLSVLKSMQYLLASEGFKVRPFNKAEDFLAHASTHHVPVVVTDIWMDGVTGLEVLARLCAISPKTRVIVITAREDLGRRRCVCRLSARPSPAADSGASRSAPPAAGWQIARGHRAGRDNQRRCWPPANGGSLGNVRNRWSAALRW